MVDTYIDFDVRRVDEPVDCRIHLLEGPVEYEVFRLDTKVDITIVINYRQIFLASNAFFLTRDRQLIYPRSEI